MFDPFATAFAALLRAPGSVAGIYVPKGCPPFPAPIRAIREMPGEEVSLRIGKAMVDTNVLIFAMSDVPAPQKGDTYAIAGGETLTVLAAPKRDAEGLGWRVPVG